jgi:hypothetical protein
VCPWWHLPHVVPRNVSEFGEVGRGGCPGGTLAVVPAGIVVSSGSVVVVILMGHSAVRSSVCGCILVV